MFVKFQNPDTNCLRIFNSTKTVPPKIGVSIKPPVKKFNDQNKQKQQKYVLEFPSTEQKLEGPRGKFDRNGISGGRIEVRGGGVNGKTGVLKKDDMTKDGYVENPDRTSEQNVKLGKNLRSVGGNVRRVVKSGVKYGNSGGVNEVQTKCSTKWARYGGSIPAMLEALETVNNLDEALKPWEATLTNKERSILLKEQVGWERAMEIFEWFKKKRCYEVNVIHYNIMLRILGKARKWPEVEKLWGEMGKKKIEPINSTYGTLIDVYCKGGQRDGAMKWLDLMNERGMQPDEVTMGIVVSMYKKAGDFKKAEEFFKKWSVFERGALSKNKMSGNGGSKESVHLSAYTYNTLIDTYGKAGKLLKASETFEKMLKKGIVPNTVTFNTMIHMYGNNGQLDEVASLMRRMEASKCSPDTRTYNILISLHAKHDDIELASKYFIKMKDASLEPDAVSYRTLLYAFSIRRMVREAEELISEMDEKGLEIDEFTQSSLTRMYIEAEMLERAWSWFERFHIRENMTSECYSANIDAFGERGYILEAKKVFDCSLKMKKSTVLEFNVMIKAYGISKKFDEACLLFDNMEKHGLVPDRCGYNSLVQMLASNDLPHKAIFYLRKMQEVGLVIDCVPYCAVISSYAKLGRLDLAVGLYDEMIGFGVKPDVIVYGVLINAFADTGSVKEATFYVNTMSNMGLPLNGVICKSLIKLYTKVGYLNEAQEMHEKLRSFETGSGSVDVYSSNCMIDLYSERSMVLEAENIFENLTRNGDANEFTYAMMLCMYKRNGRFADAYGIAKRMRELGLMTELLSYNNVLGLYASDGRYKEAVATFNEMLKSRVPPDNSTFKSLAIILLKCGVPKGAIEKIEAIRKRDSESGVREWESTLSSVVDMDDDDDDDDVDVV